MQIGAELCRVVQIGAERCREVQIQQSGEVQRLCTRSGTDKAERCSGDEVQMRC